jgi:hypothetical protein
MPDVFHVLKKDHDEVKAMLAQLEAGPKASTGATPEQLMFRKQALDAVIIEQSKHEAAEQQVFWPAVKQLGPDGVRVAEIGLEQEAEADKLLAGLDKLNADDEGFEEQVIAYEEAHAWPLLKASVGEEEAQLLGSQITEAKKLAPTRPHPHIPPQGGPAKTAGPMAGLADRLRDSVTGRGKAGS